MIREALENLGEPFLPLMKQYQKLCTEMINDNEKGDKTEVKLIEIINENHLSFHRKSNVQKVLLPSNELLDHVYEKQNHVELKEDNPYG